MVIPFIGILSFPSLVWFANPWTVIGNDASRYMLASMYLFSGRNFVTLAGNHGPVLPALIGLLTLLFGRDTDTLAWAVRLLALLNPLLAYFLVKKLSGPLAGLVSAALVALLGYNMTASSAFNIDGVMLTVYLLALLILIAAVQRDNPSLAFLSGLLLGASILTKETALANIPLALLAVLLLNWRLRGALLHYLGLALVCLPWWAWVYSFDGKIYLVGNLPTGLQLPSLVVILVLMGLASGAYSSGAITRLLDNERLRLWAGWLVVVAWTVSLSGLLLSSGSHALSNLSYDGLKQYLSELLYPVGIVVPVLLLIAGYMIWKTRKRDAPWRLLTLALLFQAPVILLVAIEGWAWRQFLVPQSLLFCALAALVVDAIRVTVRGRTYSGRFLAAFAAASLTILLLAAAGEQVRYLLPGKTENVAKEHQVAPEASKMINWMSRNVPEGKNILVSSAQANYVIFLDGGQHDWSQIKLDQSICVPRPNVQMRCDVNQNDVSQIPRNAVWVQMVG
ncbi:MAG: glycosyltransferase family 39 protein, partial [Rubrobacteraceae bacterium]